MSLPIAEKRSLLILSPSLTLSLSDFHLYREKLHPKVPNVLESKDIVPTSSPINVDGISYFSLFPPPNPL